MRTILLALFALMVSGGVWAQTDSLLIESEQKIIETDRSLEALRQEIVALNEELSQRQLSNIKQVAQHLETMQAKLKKVDSVQTLTEKRELDVYVYNYHAAVVGLKKLQMLKNTMNLFISTQEFYTKLNDIGNPLSYPKYVSWNHNFNQYIEKNKKKNVILGVLQNFINKDSSVTGFAINNVPYMNLLSEGISLFMQASKKNASMIEQSSDILQLTAHLSAFNREIDMVNNKVSTDLMIGNFEIAFDTVLIANMACLGEDVGTFTRADLGNSDYTKKIESKAREYVESVKRKNPDNWKTEVSLLLNDVQKISADFGEITWKIYKELKEYRAVIAKYKLDTTDLVPHIAGLEASLANVLNNYETSFAMKEASQIIKYKIP